MKQLITIIILSAFALQSCQQASPGTQVDLEAKIEEKEAAIKELQAELEELRKQLPDSLKTEDVSYTLIRTKAPSLQAFTHYIEVPGRADSRQNIVVSAESMGRVTRILKHEGQSVKKGDIIATLEGDVLNNQIAELKTRLELATKVYEKQKKLWDQNIGSELDYLQAKNNKDALENNLSALRAQASRSSIVAPISGYLDEVFIKEGQMVNVGTPSARLVDLKHIRVEADVSENYIGQFEQGDTAHLNFPGVDANYRLPISNIGQVVSSDNRTFSVEFELENKETKIKPNVLANVKIPTYFKEQTIVISTSLIQQDKEGDFVYVVRKENGQQLARKQRIEVGKNYSGKSEILSGLKPEDQLITLGGRQLSEGDPVKIQE